MKTGFSLGSISALLAMALGVCCAQRGFYSSPYDSWDLGAFWGSLCAILGVACGLIGAIAGRSMARHPTSVASPPDRTVRRTAARR